MTKRSPFPPGSFTPSDTRALRRNLLGDRKKLNGGHVFAHVDLMMDDDGVFSLKIASGDTYITVPFVESDIPRLKRQMQLFKRVKQQVGSLTLASAVRTPKPFHYKKSTQE